MCFEDIADDSVVKYRLSEVDNFKTFVYCSECLELLIDEQWTKYTTNLKKVDCEKSLLSLINDGTPVNFRDSLIEENKEIYEFYYNGKICSAKLKGALNENERKNLHNKLVNIAINLQNGSDYDYLNRVNELIIEFGL
jgi:hypothetical protein